jgi:triacylglycerol esterase/lipase EstA (alpha/beta hydrolase family)
MFRLRSAAISVAAGLVLFASQLFVAPATVLGRTDNMSKPIIFIHGYDGSGCDRDWWDLVNFLKRMGFTGKYYMLNYLDGDDACPALPGGQLINSSLFGFGSHTGDTNYGHTGTSHTHDTSIRHLAYHLAWYIWSNFTSRGVDVDVVAHSMGGLVIRYAVSAVEHGLANFPASLFVEDVVTLGTPHNGAFFSSWLDTLQGREMEPDATLITWLKNNAQWPSGTHPGSLTDWTVIGSYNDLLVGQTTATSMRVLHRFRYDQDPEFPIGHMDYMHVEFPGRYFYVESGNATADGDWHWVYEYFPVEMTQAALTYGVY